MKIVFRKFKSNNEVIAYFWDKDLPVNRHRVMSYMHIGQHGEASLTYTDCYTVPASPQEYADLLRELTGIYNDVPLEIRARLNHKEIRATWVQS